MSPATATPMTRSPRLRRWLSSVLLLGLCLAPFSDRKAAADDKDLLRTGGGEPAVFLLIDTSASMALKLAEPDATGTFTNEWAVGWADGPDSRLYQAKQAVYNVFKDASDIDFALAGMNQDHLRVLAKHYIYYNSTALGSAWPIDFPRPDTDGLTALIKTPCADTNGDGTIDSNDDVSGCPADTRIGDVDGDVLTVGPSYLDTGGNPITTANTCATAFDLGNAIDREKVQSFAISSSDSTTPNVIWVKEGGSIYRLDVSYYSTDTTTFPNPLGTSALGVNFVATQYNSCAAGSTGGPYTLRLAMSYDENLGQSFVVDPVLTGQHQSDCRANECRAGLWNWTDVESTWDVAGKAPFEGQGWEGNYDSGDLSGDSIFDANVSNDDPYCSDPLDPTTCVEAKPFAHTQYSSLGHAIDSGDMVPFPFTGDASNIATMRDRIAPIGPDGRDFRGAPFFIDDSSRLYDALELEFPSTKPMLAADVTPLSATLLDFRCWFSGRNSTPKCPSTNPFDMGYKDIACTNDSGVGCRSFFFIVISDGEDNAGQVNSPPSNLSDGGEFDTRMWFLNVGDPKNCTTGTLSAMLANTNSRNNCVVANNPAKLKSALSNILGQIREQVRAFASAAVPSVQATVENKIFLTTFTPLNNEAYWYSRADAYLKPLPLDNSNKPDTTKVCSSSLDRGCLLWNAGSVILSQTPDNPPANPADYLGATADRRRVFYAPREATTGSTSPVWNYSRRLLEPPPTTGSPTDTHLRYDMWRGFGLIGEDVVDGSLTNAQETALQTRQTQILVGDDSDSVAPEDIQGVLEEKTANVDPDPNLAGDEFDVTYVVGDTFHSTPLVVGTPPATTFFVNNYGDNGNACDDTTAPNPGYRCFFLQNRYRRKVLLMGADDGQVHAYDAGMFHGDGDTTSTDGVDPITNRTLTEEFDNGKGFELFSYMPRQAMPDVTAQSEGDVQFYGVDGPPTVGDVFIDPGATSTTDPGTSVPNRKWRTVLVGGLREGGRGYYALDITTPDPVSKLTVAGQLTYVPDPPSTDGDRVPACNGVGSLPSGCNGSTYPKPLWEYDGSFPDGAGGVTYEDMDGNGIADLGDTWSTPTLGVILVCREGGTSCNPDTPDNATPFFRQSGSGDVIPIPVAIFGGGMDTVSKTSPTNATKGNWLYMVNVENGQVIYKRKLVGAAPSAPAAVDINGDGIIDRIYIGTIAGKLYRVDLGVDGSGNLPALQSQEIGTLNCDPATETCRTQDRIVDTDPSTVDQATWDPYIIFNTQVDALLGSTAIPRPIYFRPSVLFIAQRNFFALAFGTGDRENLFNLNGALGRFYLFGDVSEGPSDANLPYDETDLLRIAPTDANVSDTTNFLLTPGSDVPGWYLTLPADERVITDAFSLSGVTVFSAFLPEIVVEGEAAVVCGATSPGGGGGGGGGGGAPICSKLGSSHIFAVNTVNANGLLASQSYDPTDPTTQALVRSVSIGQFVSNPFAESSATKKTNEESQTDSNADVLDARLNYIMNTLKGLYPKNCTFANYRIDVKTIAADTQLQFIAPVPVCIVQKNWKEY